MRNLWAPWRMRYVTGIEQPESGCVLCEALVHQDEASSLVIGEDGDSFIVMNKFPYSSGHLMVLPKRHVATLLEITSGEQLSLMALVQRAIRLLDGTFHPEGYNIGVNHGEAAGASLSHLHVHVVPRWIGDTNFMPVIGEAKVMPEELGVSAAKLRAAFEGGV